MASCQSSCLPEGCSPEPAVGVGVAKEEDDQVEKTE